MTLVSCSFPLGAVLFDFDDTLAPQAPWLEGAFGAVALQGELLFGVPAPVLLQALLAEARAGSARGGIIDRALQAAGVTGPPSGIRGSGRPDGLASLLDAFHAYRAPVLEPYAGVRSALGHLRRSGVKIGIVTDGNPASQRAKLAASGLDRCSDVTVLSDELGREHRKPDPAPYLAALDRLGTTPARAAFVGDRPTTDLVGAAALGMVTVRVRTGEYARDENVVLPDADVPDAVAAVGWLLGRCG